MRLKAEGFEASSVKVHFDGLKAVDGVDLALSEGHVLGLIGPNGAGKTTLINALTGFEKLAGGTVRLDGVDVTRWSPRRLCKHGVTRTFQAVRLFERLTVLENVLVGTLLLGGSRRQAREAAWQLLDAFSLSDKANLPAGSLPYGDERRLGMARALGPAPRFLFLDEPAAGMSEKETDELVEVLDNVKERFGCGLLIIEHDMRLIMDVCDRVQVLDYGRTIALGEPKEVRQNSAVLEAYLG